MGQNHLCDIPQRKKSVTSRRVLKTFLKGVKIYGNGGLRQRGQPHRPMDKPKTNTTVTPINVFTTVPKTKLSPI